MKKVISAAVMVAGLSMVASSPTVAAPANGMGAFSFVTHSILSLKCHLSHAPVQPTPMR